MIKNLVFTIFVLVCLIVLFTNIGFETALAMVGKCLDYLVTYLNQIK